MEVDELGRYKNFGRAELNIAIQVLRGRHYFNCLTGIGSSIPSTFIR